VASRGFIYRAGEDGIPIAIVNLGPTRAVKSSGAGIDSASVRLRVSTWKAIR